MPRSIEFRGRLLARRPPERGIGKSVRIKRCRGSEVRETKRRQDGLSELNNKRVFTSKWEPLGTVRQMVLFFRGFWR